MESTDAAAWPRIDPSRSRPVVLGTDIKVSQIASEYEHLGMSPDDIVEAHPHLTLADVHSALAYYYAHSADIRREWQEAEALIGALRNPERAQQKSAGK
jgi:uncharacterized protein (DUF433 family)